MTILAVEAAQPQASPLPRKTALGRWKKLRDVTLGIAAMKIRLRRSIEMRMAAEDEKRVEHARYMGVLRTGVHSLAIMDSALVRSRGLALTRSAASNIVNGKVVAEVASEAQLEELALWQQGDSSLYASEKVEKRVRLRTHARVRSALQQFWESAQRSYGGGDAFASTIGFEVSSQSGMHAALAAPMQLSTCADAAPRCSQRLSLPF